MLSVTEAWGCRSVKLWVALVGFRFCRTVLSLKMAENIRPAWLVFLVALSVVNAGPGEARSLLVISIDGMRPDYVTAADEHGLRIPVLRSLASNGCYADGVTGVLPTITYPSHVTLLTGVTPRVHGIASNWPFDPLGEDDDGSNWYAGDIHSETLWEAAARRNISVASVAWPVSVGAGGVRWLVPEYGKGAPDDVKAIRAFSQPQGMLESLEAELGATYTDQGEEEGDAVRTRFALGILRRYKPGLMTVHLTGLDGRSHEHGPFSPQADAALEAIDGMVGSLQKAAVANDPDTVVAIVSDHGFLPVTQKVNLVPAFVNADLAQLDASGTKIISWQAMPWVQGGSSAIVLARRDNPALRENVRMLLARLAADPINGIAKVIERDEIAARGGAPEADFWVDFQPGFVGGSAVNQPIIVQLDGIRGAHGYFPGNPALRASFIISGRGLARCGSLGVVDMRAIAPTLADVLGLKLPGAEMGPIDLKAFKETRTSPRGQPSERDTLPRHRLAKENQKGGFMP